MKLKEGETIILIIAILLKTLTYIREILKFVNFKMNLFFNFLKFRTMSTTYAFITVTICAAHLAKVAVGSRFDALTKDDLEIYEPGNVYLARFYTMTTDESLLSSSDQNTVWKLGNESCNEARQSNDDLYVSPDSMCRAYHESEEHDRCVSV